MSDQFDSKKSKNKQRALLIGGSAAIVLCVSVIILSTDNKPQQRVAQKPVPLNIDATVTSNISDTEILSQQTRSDISDVQQQMNDLQSQLKAQKETESAHMNSLSQQVSQEFIGIKAQLEDIKKAPPPSLSGFDGLPAAGGKNIGLPSPESVPMVDEPEITSINLSDGSNESGTTSAGKQLQSTNKVKNRDTFLPISFVKVKGITAMDAPCGGTSQDNPYPMLFNVTDSAQLANGMKTKLKGCFLLASGYGDVASERAYLRLEMLSCVTKKGEVINSKVEGYIAGEDGKAGLRGNLVSKAGSKVALALLSGTVGGLGQAFASMATTLQQTPIGPTQIVTPNQSVGYAGATGAAQGFNQLSQYYINMAEKTFPVIEIVNQRNVTAVFTKGLDLPVDMNDMSGGNKSLPISLN